MTVENERRLRGSLEDRLRFEKLAADVSSRFINLDSVEFDAEIEKALALTGRFLGGDRCFTFLLDKNGEHHRMAHMWTAAGIETDSEARGFVLQERFAWLGEKMQRHEDIVVNSLDDLPPHAEGEREYCESRGLRAFMMCPMCSRDGVVGNIGLDMVGSSREWQTEDARRLRLIGEIVANAVVRVRKDREIESLRNRIEAENVYLRKRIEAEQRHESIIGESAALKLALSEAEHVAATDSIVLLQGETGTGKELFAHAIHRMSGRRDRQMVSVNCAALATTLIESELFGREKGAYTGALSRQVGRFELAHETTLFLDEIGELPAEVQAKLLRVLQSGEFERLGGTTTRRVDVRVIAATNRDLERAAADGSFRKDLFYRVNVFPIVVPPLRDRLDDIPLLVWAFVKEFERSIGRRIESIPEADMGSLQRYHWPGNVRELRNVIERAMIREHSATLRFQVPATGDIALDPSAETLEDVERRHILLALERVGWRVRGVGGAAESLGLKPTTLESRMARLGIRRNS